MRTGEMFHTLVISELLRLDHVLAHEVSDPGLQQNMEVRENRVEVKENELKCPARTSGIIEWLRSDHVRDDADRQRWAPATSTL
jgi:hypothetical protein